MKNKYVMIVGVLDVRGSTNIPMATAFMKRGYKIVPINYRTILKNHNMPYLENVITRAIERYEPELILFSKVNAVSPYIVDKCSRSSKTYYWFMDNIDVATKIKADVYVKRANFASATSSEVVEMFKKHNDNSTQIIEGYDSSVFFKEDIKKEYDVVFFGMPTTKRLDMLSKLDGVTMFGNGWPEKFNSRPHVVNGKLRDVINKSRIVLNLVHSNIFSDRVVMTCGCGTFLLSEYCSDLDKYFENGKHLVTFKNIDECSELINYYLNNGKDKREEIARNGMEFVSENHTWSNCINNICEFADVG